MTWQEHRTKSEEYSSAAVKELAKGEYKEAKKLYESAANEAIKAIEAASDAIKAIEPLGPTAFENFEELVTQGISLLLRSGQYAKLAQFVNDWSDGNVSIPEIVQEQRDQIWQEYIARSEENAALAEQAFEVGKFKDAKRLFKLSADDAIEAIEVHGEDNVEQLGQLIIKAVLLRLRSGQYSKSMQLAQQWIARNLLPDDVVGQLREQIVRAANEITKSEAKKRAIGDTVPVTSDDSPENNPEQQPGFVRSTVNVLEDVVNEIAQLNSEALQQQCLAALRLSITLDIDHYPPEPKCPKEIYEEDVGVSLDLLKKLNIVLTKDAAFEFLTKLGIAPKKSKFRRNLTADSYEKFFNRKVSKIGKKTLVFTYAEILHMENLTIQLDIPDLPPPPPNI